MAANDLYLLTLYGSIFGQQVVNTFTYYQVTEETAPEVASEVLARSFYSVFFETDQVLNGNAYSTAMTYSAIRVVNLFSDASDFYELVIEPQDNGAGVGAAMPPYVCYAFRTPWLGQNMRRGQKRFAGVLETEVNNGILTENILTLLDDTRSRLGQTLLGSSGTWKPVIVRRVKTYNQDKNRYEYSLPSNPSELYQVDANQWQTVIYSSTQNSRKYGRGA